MTGKELEVLNKTLSNMLEDIEKSNLIAATELSGMRGLYIMVKNQRALISVVKALVEDKIEEVKGFERLADTSV